MRTTLSPLFLALLLVAGCSCQGTKPAADKPGDPAAAAPVEPAPAPKEAAADEAAEAPPTSPSKLDIPLAGEAKLEAEAIRNLLGRGELRDAIPRAFTLSEQHPESTEAGLVLASAYTLAERYGDAERTANRILALDETLVGAWVTLGAAKRGQGEVEEALEATQRALAIDGNNKAALGNFARLLGDKGELAEQQQVLEKLIELHPDDADAHLALSQNRGQQGDLMGALKAANGAVKVEPRHLQSHVYQSVTLYALNRYLQAMDHAEVALRIDDEEPVASEIFRKSFYLSMAIALQCQEGAGPWSRAQIRKQINTGRYPLKAMPGVLEFERLHKEFGASKGNQKRILEGAADCNPTASPKASGEGKAPPAAAAEDPAKAKAD